MTDQSAPPMPQPTAEHHELASYAGTWNVSCKFYMDPAEPPMETDAIETVETVGEFWTLSEYKTEFMGAPFVGRATMGYEPHTGHYVSTWIDCMSPVLFHFTGEKKGDTITMRGKAHSCMTNSILDHRTTEKHINKNERLFEMFCTLPDGTEIKMMTSHYRRA
jgi:hypothetical protein